MNFDVWRCLVAGIISTAVMSGFVNAFENYVARKFRIAPLLGTMLTGETTLIKGISFSNRAIYVGQLVHYLVGCLLSLLYYFWCIYRGGFTVLNTLLYGIFAGSVAVVAWRAFFFVHSRPPRINLNGYCKLLFAGHLILAVILFVIYSV